jgi:hypothetical protein
MGTVELDTSMDNVHCNVKTARIMPIKLNMILKHHKLGDDRETN